MNRALLDIQDLQVHFHTPEGVARAVDRVSLEIGPGETVGLVGESGCGKSVTSLAVLGLIPSPPGKIEGGRIVFFEGTYTNTFSGNPDQTPRYNYNQVMYKLDLGDPRLVLPVAVYRLSGEEGRDRLATAERLDRSGARPVAFFACDREGEGSIPIFGRKTRAGQTLLPGIPKPEDVADGEPEPLFYALPADMKDPPAATVPLYEYVHKEGVKRDYLPGGSQSVPEFRRVEPPICLVWRDPNVAQRAESTDP